jgi:hypothetical protein
MNAADLARLELAKRAYKATQPSESEIQTGVRRARLSIGRPRPRRNWFSKGLVFVALAIGSLAYAKPHALGELVESVLPRADSSGKNGGVGTAALGLPPETSTDFGEAPAKPGLQGATALNGLTPNAAQNANDATTAGENGSHPESATPAAAAAPTTAVANPATSAKSARRSGRPTAPAPAAPAQLDTPDAATAVSDWGRVGQALARGDETQALATLGELSESDDQRTRDKADIGRVQLLLAHGDRDKACALARSLTNRRAGGLIERQAQALLKSCTR